MPLDDTNRSGPTNEESLDALREYKRLRRTVDEANNLLRGYLKRCKGEGHDTKAIIAVAAAEKRDPDDDVQTEVRNTLHLMALRKVISIDEALKAADDLNVTKKAVEEDSVWDAEDRGYRAGRHGADRGENPFKRGTDTFSAWDKWWGRGKAAVALELGPQAKQADASKEKPKRGEPKKIAAPVADGDKPRGRGRPKGSGNKAGKLTPRQKNKARHDPIPDPPSVVN